MDMEDVYMQWRMLRPLDDLRKRLRRPTVLPPKRDTSGSFVLIDKGEPIKIPSWMKKKLWDARKNSLELEEVDDKSESDFGGMISPLSGDCDPGLRTTWSHLSVNCPSTISAGSQDDGRIDEVDEGDKEDEKAKDEEVKDEELAVYENEDVSLFSADGDNQEEKETEDGEIPDEDSDLWIGDRPAFVLRDLIAKECNNSITEFSEFRNRSTCELGRFLQHEGIMRTPINDVLFLDSSDAREDMLEVNAAYKAITAELKKYEAAYKYQSNNPTMQRIDLVLLGNNRTERLQYMKKIMRVLRYQLFILQTKRVRIQRVLEQLMDESPEEECKRTQTEEWMYRMLRELDAKRERIVHENKRYRLNKDTLARNRMISQVIKPIPAYKLLANYTFITEKGRNAAYELIKPSLSEEVAIIDDKEKNLAIMCYNLRCEIQRHLREKQLLREGYEDHDRMGVHIPAEFQEYNEKRKYINAKIKNFRDERESLKREREGLLEEKRLLIELKTTSSMKVKPVKSVTQFRPPPFRKMGLKQQILSRRIPKHKTNFAKGWKRPEAFTWQTMSMTNYC